MRIKQCDMMAQNSAIMTVLNNKLVDLKNIFMQKLPT